MDAERSAWAAERRRAVEARAAAQHSARAAEAAEARKLIAGFVRRARERGLRPAPLVARALTGRARYRTGLTGWYLRADRSVAVGTDGEFYVLEVPASLRARIAGARPTPSKPRLVLGAGGRDGESLPLAVLLERRLAAGDDGP